MHEFVSFNRQIRPAETVFLSAENAAALYGKSVFTTVAVYNFQPFLWKKHWERLSRNAKKIGVDVADFDEDSVADALAEIIVKNNFRDGRARLTFYDESPTAVWQNRSPKKTSFLIQTVDFRPLKKTLKLMISSFPINSKSPLAGVKCGNYLENMLAWEDARAKNFDEAIRLNEKGEIVSACLANVFWRIGGEIFTPHLATGCLEGVTRGFVLENQMVMEVKAPLHAICKADEIFLTSAGIGIVKAEIIR